MDTKTTQQIIGIPTYKCISCIYYRSLSTLEQKRARACTAAVRLKDKKKKNWELSLPVHVHCLVAGPLSYLSRRSLRLLLLLLRRRLLLLQLLYLLGSALDGHAGPRSGTAEAGQQLPPPGDRSRHPLLLRTAAGTATATRNSHLHLGLVAPRDLLVVELRLF